MTEPRGDSRSGPCLTNQHDRCTYAPCPCTCGHPNRACNGCPFTGCEGCQYQGGDAQTIRPLTLPIEETP